jgi:outer membrane immunogenic protein
MLRGNFVSKRRFAVGIIAAGLVVATGGAQAADMAVKAPAAAAPIYSWTGLYIGANVGFGIGENNGRVNVPAAGGTPSFDLAPVGVIGGGQIGYNWEVGGWVLGVEADIQGSGVDSSANCVFTCSPGANIGVSQSMPWFGTVRGRLGSSLGNLMIYNTAGFAYGKVNTTINEAVLGGTGSFPLSETRTGWTVGSGVEANLGNNWIGRVEYLFIDLGDVKGSLLGTTQSFVGRAQQHVMRMGASYKFGQPSAPPTISTGHWAGFYAGGNFGAGLGRNNSTLAVGAPIGPFAESFDVSPRGWVGGGQVGYNWQAGNVVYGIEADLQATTQESTQTCAMACIPGSLMALKQELPWFGTVRGRLGYTVGQGLFFVSGGYAYGEVKNKVTELFGATPATTVSFSETKGGFAVGGGVETPVPNFFGWRFPNWTTRTEYLYVDLGSVTNSYNYGLGNAAHTLTSDVRNHIFRTTYSYKFGGL